MPLSTAITIDAEIVVRPQKRQTGERICSSVSLSSLLMTSLKTELAYLRDTYAFKTSSSSDDDDVSTVLDVLKTTKTNDNDDDERWYSYCYEIVLDKTIAPAGGGQPSDGTILIDTNTQRWMFDSRRHLMDKETKQVLHAERLRRKEEENDDVFDVDEMRGNRVRLK